MMSGDHILAACVTLGVFDYLVGESRRQGVDPQFILHEIWDDESDAGG